MKSFLPDPSIRTQKVRIGDRTALVLSPKEKTEKGPGVLWIHGGGYFLGMKEMVYMAQAAELVRRCGAVIVSPGYRLAVEAPYPAALEDCYEALLWMKENAESLGIRDDQLMVGGESAGGGLCAALCMKARDTGAVKIAFQMPLYPMLDNFDTESSKDNHGRIWNTKRNHLGWKLYLRGNAGKEVSPYASAARQTDFSGLPPVYTFVGDGEPFYAETLAFVQHLQDAGVPAHVDVYHTDMHAFDMMHPEWEISKEATEHLAAAFAKAASNCFAPQD